jgi:hypothetical protein
VKIWSVLQIFGEGIEGWICASPNTAGAVVQVAVHGTRAAMGNDAGLLVGKQVGREDHFRLHRYFLPGVIAVPDFNDLPHFLCHKSSPVGMLVKF